MSGLFVARSFVGSAGRPLEWKIECDALSDDDWDTLAMVVSRRLVYGPVEGVPTGGERFARALRHFSAASGALLIADDVLTTGASMERCRAGREAYGVVAFARTDYCARSGWIWPLFTLTYGEQT